jgi:membrane fusion protein, multidrug efflux system
LGESTVLYAATASAFPKPVAVITEGVLISMFLSKVKLVMTATAVVAALAAGAVALAQSGIGRPNYRSGKPLHVSPPSWTDHILVSRNGEPPPKAAVVETTGEVVLFQPKRDQNPANPSGANSSRSENDREHSKIVLTSPQAMDVAITQRFVCQIHSRRHIDVCALESGHLNEIKVSEGQAVKKGDEMFKIVPTLNKAKLDAVWANVKAPFDGIIGRLREKQGSLIKEGDILTTLSDNSVMWVYFNVPEKQYLEYMANRNEYEEKIELVLANQTKFPQPGKLGAIEGQVNIATGNIAFRADFRNPDGLLHHGQTGTIVVHRKAHDAIVIPLRATYEIMNKRYVYVADKDDVVHRREIVVQNEVDDIFVIKKGVGVGDRIVLEGIRQVRDGDKVEYEFRLLRWGRLRRTARVRDGEEVEYEFRPPEEVMRKLRNHAE